MYKNLDRTPVSLSFRFSVFHVFLRSVKVRHLRSVLFARAQKKFKGFTAKTPLSARIGYTTLMRLKRAGTATHECSCLNICPGDRIVHMRAVMETS